MSFVRPHRVAVVGRAVVLVVLAFTAACSTASGDPPGSAPAAGSGSSDAGPPGAGASGDAGADGVSPPPGQSRDSGAVNKPTSFSILSEQTGTLPFTVGLGFGRGDVPATFTLDVPDGQIDIKRRWNDGSVKHAVVSGLAPMVAGKARVVRIVEGQYAESKRLGCADIQAAAPDVVADFGTFGKVALASMLATPIRTWLSGPEAVECHYASRVGSDPTLRTEMHVRLYNGGRVFVRVVAENGYLDVDTTEKTFLPDVRIAGVSVFDNGKTPLVQYAHTRWVAEGWIGGDPKLTVRHDTAYLIGTRLVPSYWTKKTAASAALDALYSTYVPMAKGDWTQSMGDTGYQAAIGLLPNHDALYFTSGADPRALRGVVANALALGSYPIVWRDGADGLPTRPSARPTWTVLGAGGGGSNGMAAGPLAWEVAHHPSGGYLAYLLTGDHVHLETMQHQAATVYLVSAASNGEGTSRILRGQTRGSAWSQRTVGQLAAIGPSDDPVTLDHRALLAANASHWSSEASRLGANALGLVYEYDPNAYGPAKIAPWQHSFFVQTYGHLSDLEPLADMTALDAVRDFLYRIPVGLLGDGASSYCYARASNYTITVAARSVTDLSQTYSSWHDVDTATNAGAGACNGALVGGSGGAPQAAATGYWGNLLPSIAYAVDHAAPGADAAWRRLTAAPNWSVVEGGDWSVNAPWAIVPRGFDR